MEENTHVFIVDRVEIKKEIIWFVHFKSLTWVLSAECFTFLACFVLKASSNKMQSWAIFWTKLKYFITKQNGNWTFSKRGRMFLLNVPSIRELYQKELFSHVCKFIELFSSYIKQCYTYIWMLMHLQIVNHCCREKRFTKNNFLLSLNYFNIE